MIEFQKLHRQKLSSLVFNKKISLNLFKFDVLWDQIDHQDELYLLLKLYECVIFMPSWIKLRQSSNTNMNPFKFKFFLCFTKRLFRNFKLFTRLNYTQARKNLLNLLVI